MAMPDPSPKVFGTFGFYRYVLACMVVITHTIPSLTFIGVYAVFGFFILSGYIVSYILHYTYLPQPYGIWKYLTNRALRIYPAYWIALMVSAFLVIYHPQQAHDIFPAIGYPHGTGEWFANIFTFGMANPWNGRLIEPSLLPISWSLGIELLCWVWMIVLPISQEWQNRIIFASCLYSLLALLLSLSHPYDESLSPRYFSMLAASLPFCIGFLLFKNKQQGKFHIPHYIGLSMLPVFFCFLYVAFSLFTNIYFAGFYISIGIEAVTIAYLAQISQQCLPLSIQKLDNFFGNITYPIFLLHLPVALALHLAFPSMRLYDTAYCIIIIAASSATGWILHALVETPVNHLRRMIKC